MVQGMMLWYDVVREMMILGRKIMSEREEKLKKMLQAIQKEYNDTLSKMEKLRVEDKSKTMTY